MFSPNQTIPLRPADPPGRVTWGRPLGPALGVGLLLGAIAQPGWASGAEARGASVDFDRDIRPIFSENCYACHGPDEAKRKAKLRLDRKEEAFKELKDGGYAIVPGDLSKSKHIQRISSKDEVSCPGT
jgi:hypothetical protein